MKAVNLGVLFLIELAAVAAAGWWGASTSWPWLLGPAAPAAMIAAWALFGSPRARFRMRGAARAGFELLWFGAGVGALYAAGAQGWGLALAVVCAVSKGLAFRWDQ
ncbi:YrdB family protein [Streptomyces sp. IBSBF 2953]|uniref:YrdB family protein n=1 Tax=Streptomyces TaxID=1883 RepID=UPI002119C547|nr:YrdB family protein [Streptomyces scabiei]MCQ9178212.1 YrdB family protein [Streptomyces hayashii]MDX3116522.1 YrdB family protein [Streptomyces scabiei]